MSKSKTGRRFDDYDEYNMEHYKESMQEHRRQKRLANILRSRNVDLLMQLEEDEYDE